MKPTKLILFGLGMGMMLAGLAIAISENPTYEGILAPLMLFFEGIMLFILSITGVSIILNGARAILKKKDRLKG